MISAVLIAACSAGGGGGSSANQVASAQASVSIADIKLLFFGNSHTSANNLTGMVEVMLRAGLPGRSIAVHVAADGLLLQERGSDAASIALIRSQRWSAVIFQGQNYSSSGQFTYPTSGAESLVRLAREQSAVPILFAEWPRAGLNETQRIFDTYLSVARNAPACVPPIPQSFDLAIARNPTVRLVDTDGNHSSVAGAFLAAAVLYAGITGQSPVALPTFPQFSVDPALQSDLRRAAADTVDKISTRTGCPGEPYIR